MSFEDTTWPLDSAHYLSHAKASNCVSILVLFVTAAPATILAAYTGLPRRDRAWKVEKNTSP